MHAFRVRGLLCSIFVFSVFLIFALSTGASAEDVSGEINNAIKESGGNWTAADNRISQMPPEERKRLLGAKYIDPESIGIPPFVNNLDSVDLPDALDWRSNGGNFVTAVTDQGDCGSCWAFAATGSFESAYLIANNLPGTSFNRSEQQVLSCSGAGDCDGGYSSSALYYIRDTGIVDEACFPYAETELPCGDICSDWASRVEQATVVSYVSNDVDEIKAALQFGPTTISFDVYEDFYYYNTGVYEYSYGEYEGGHAVTLVGYDDSEESWICKNSWSDDWGDNGYFRIRWNESGVGRSVYLPQVGNSSVDDNYEENDTAATAYDLLNYEQYWLNTIDGLGIANDYDYYMIYTNSNRRRVIVDLRFSDLLGDIDVCLTDTYGSTVTCTAGNACGMSVSDDEYIDCILPTMGNDYLIEVYPYNSTGNTYDLWWDDVAMDCTEDADCDDGNVCTDEVCNNYVCEYSNNTDPCNDNEYCTVNDQCSNGSCEGDARNCDDTLYCNGVEYCNETLNLCLHRDVPNCNDGVSCTDDSCDEATNSCVNQTNNANCDDDQWCNGAEICNAVSDCQAGTPPDCGDGVSCTDDTCDEGGDVCVHTANNANCDDGAWCNGAETCSATNDCQAGTAPDCSDGVSCTDDTCDEGGDVCVNTANDANCDDGAWCNGAEICNAVSDCQAGMAPNCNDGVDCTDDSCDEAGDTCVNDTNDANCDDGAWCNGAEVCDAVNDCQAGMAPNCDDDVDCTDDSCDEDGDTCVNAVNDANCDDGAWCNGAEVCDAVNDCQDGTAPDCSDNEIFCDGEESCDEEADSCVSSGDPCDEEETCNEETSTCDPAGDDDDDDDDDNDTGDDDDDDDDDDTGDDDDDDDNNTGDDDDDDDDDDCGY